MFFVFTDLGQDVWRKISFCQFPVRFHTVKVFAQILDLFSISRPAISHQEFPESVAEKFSPCQGRGVIDISHEIQSAVQSFDALAKDQGKMLVPRIKEGIHVVADQRCVYEIASILLDNAVKYCDEAGTITVTLTTKKIGKGAVLTVSNDFAGGKGVDYTRFFERFYRGDESHSSAKAGYGIGLSMAEELVRLLKGSINVSYKNGVITFTVTL